MIPEFQLKVDIIKVMIVSKDNTYINRRRMFTFIWECGIYQDILIWKYNSSWMLPFCVLR